MAGLLDPWAWRSDMNAPQPGPTPEARSYTPAWHDRVVDAITGGIFGPDANAQQRAGVNHIFGPDNPINLPAQVNQGYNTAKLGADLGDPAQAGIGVAQMAMSLPFGIAKGPAQAATKGIKAYHGSPHDFDRFSLDKIGTGEGAQAYGHGLYFAENEGVARGYRDALTPRNLSLADGTVIPVQNHGSQAGFHMQAAGIGDNLSANAKAVAAEIERAGSFEKAVRDVQKIIDAPGNEMAKAMAQSRLERLQQFADKQPQLSPAGRLYEVNIKANPEDFLDWDKPLSQQSEKTLKGLREGYKQSHGVSDRYLDNEWLPNRSIKDAIGAGNMSKVMTDNLRDQGIPGIKYLDQGSRTASDGSRNYVVFDDSLIEILRKYGLAGILAGGAAATAQPSTAEAKGIMQ